MCDKQNIICPNCEQEFNSKFDYCPYCGQANKKFNLNIRHVFSDFLSASFNVDSKLWLSLSLLITKPGFLTHQYLHGRRTKYLTPVRIYLLISFVYFFVIAINPSVLWKSTVKNVDNNVSVDTTDIVEKQIPDIYLVDEVDSTTSNPEVVDKDADSEIETFVWNTSKLYKTDEGKQMFRNNFRKYASMGMFILIPFTALLFFALFRKNTYYIQHLMFAFHLQSVVFLAFVVDTVLEWFVENSYIDVMFIILLMFIYYIWIKKYYKIGYFLTFWKLFVFLLGYGFLLLLFIVIVAMLSFISLGGTNG